MCSVNHDLKSVYLHTPKCGGSYVTDILERFYDFKTYYFTSEYHSDFTNVLENNYTFDNYCMQKGFFFIKSGMYKYFRYSEKFNLLTGMDKKKWKNYFKFTFVRHPFDKFISAYKYLKLYNKNIQFEKILNDNSILNYYEYFHISITQFDNLTNNENKIEFDYVAKYENLNEELIKILKILGIDTIKHKKCILENIVINSSDNVKFIDTVRSKHNKNSEKNLMLNNIDTQYELIDSNFINLFNKYFSVDYEYFNYDKINLNNFRDYLQDKNNIILGNKKLIEKYNLVADGVEQKKIIYKKDDNTNYANDVNDKIIFIGGLNKNNNNKICKYI